MKKPLLKNIPFLPLSLAGRQALLQALARLKSSINQPLDAAFIQDMLGMLQEQLVPDGCMLLDFSDFPACVWFVVTGRMVAFYRDGHALRIQWMFRDRFFILPHNLLSSERSPFRIETFSECRLVSIRKDDYLKLIDTHPEAFLLTNIWRDRFEEQLLFQLRKLFKGTIEQTLSYLKADWPGIFSRLSKASVAEYLGRTRESVSRRKG